MKNFKYYARFLVFTIVFSLISCSSDTSSKSGDTVVETYDLIKNEKFEKASKMYVSKEGEKLTDAEVKMMESICAMAFDQHKKKDGVDNIQILEEKISDDGNTAKVNFTIHFNNGDIDNETVNLQKMSGKWFLKI